MKPAVKASLILVSTLLVGVLLGSVLTGALARQRARQVDEFRERDGFVRNIMRTIQPRDEEQRRELRPIIEATARENAEIMAEMHEGLKTAMDDMLSTLEPLLEPDQFERLSNVARMPPPREGVLPRPGRSEPPPPRRDGPPPDRRDAPATGQRPTG